MAVLGIFLAATVLILPRTFSVYTSMQGYHYGQQTSFLLSDELRVRFQKCEDAFTVSEDQKSLTYRGSDGGIYTITLVEQNGKK